VLNIIHESYAYIPLTANYILQLHRDMLKFTELSYGGMFKTTPNEIAATLPDGTKRVLFKPLEPYETPAAVEAACRSFNECLEKELVSPLLLIPYFIVDFLCIHPFNDGNGRMSRLLTLLLLYRSGYMVGRYISIEKAIADTKENYYDALYASDQNWLAEKNNPLPFIKYMLGVILACYRDFERRITISAAVGQKSTAYDIVKVYTDNKLGTFTKQDVLKNCPSIGKASVEAALKRLVEEHYIEKIGAGRSTCYARK
jgi:Fic family protein